MADNSASSGHRSLIFGHINAHSLLAHRHDIHDLILRSQPLVFGISKSFLKPADSSAREQIPGYTLFRHDRLGKRCGGVALYVHNSARCKIVDKSARPATYLRAPEYILAEVSFERLKFLCALVYSPPKAGYWRHVEEAILNCNSAYDQLLIMGDLNIE